MEDNIKVTVCCLAYNHEKYIRKALESFVSQKTNFKYEVIVNDDASTDNTASIIREFAEKYPDIIKPIFQTQNQCSKKISIFTTHIAPRIKGKYIAFCECDDYWTDENKLQIQYDIMEANPSVSLCVHKVECVNEDGSFNSRVFPEQHLNIRGTKLILQQEYADILLLKGGYPFHTSSYFRKKDIFFSKIYNELSHINSDQKILFTSLAEGDVYYIDKAMSHRRLMSIGNYNSRLLEKSEDERLQIILSYQYAKIKFDELTFKKFHNKVAESVFNAMFYLFRRKNKKAVSRAFKDLYKSIDFDWSKSVEDDVKCILMKYFPFLIPIILKFVEKRK